MHTYYLYLLDDGGRIARRIDLETRTPAAARASAEAYPHAHGKELWRLAERLWRTEADA